MLFLNKQYSYAYPTVIQKCAVTTCVPIKDLLTLHLDRMPLFHVEFQTLIDTKSNNKIFQFQVRYICLTYLKIYTFLKDKWQKTMLASFGQATLRSIKKIYNSNNTHVIALIMIYIPWRKIFLSLLLGYTSIQVVQARCFLKKNTLHSLSVIGIPGVFTNIMSCHKLSRGQRSKLIFSCCCNFFRVTYWNGFRLWKIISKNKHLEISANLFQ